MEGYYGYKFSYITIDQFTQELVLSIAHDNSNTFLERYLQLDILLVDNFQFIVGKERTQQEFYNIYNRMLESGKRIGKEELIHAALPHYRTDAILRKVDLDRYDDRDDIRVNLLESHDRLMNFVSKHLNDNFYLEGDRRISLRDKIFRGSCSSSKYI